VQIHGDTYPALMAANAVVAALFQRSRTGEGQHLDISMAETLVYMNDWAAVELQRHQGSRAPFDIWEQAVLPLADGTGVALVGNPARQFEAWVDALGGEALHDDPRFATPEQISDHVDEAVAVIAGLMATIPDFAALERCIGSSPLLVAEVRSIADLAATPWGLDRPLVAQVAPGLRVPASPWRSDRSTVGVAGPPASRGEHNREVLEEWCGLTGEETDRLVASGALHGGPG
jgi:CoA:oxalate CoA-transferase